MKERKVVPVVIILVAIMLCISNIPKVQDASDNAEQEIIYGDGWSITGIRAERGDAYEKCDATDEMVYFCYDKNWYIDAYDYQGDYQYTIMLRKSINGGLGIHCTEDLLYAKSKDGTVFVFDGTDMVETLSSTQATEQGCNFDSANSRVYVSEDLIYRVDDAGKYAEVFPIPEEVAANMTFYEYGDRDIKNKLRFAATIIPVVLLLVFMLPWPRKRKSRL